MASAFKTANQAVIAVILLAQVYMLVLFLQRIYVLYKAATEKISQILRAIWFTQLLVLVVAIFANSVQFASVNLPEGTLTPESPMTTLMVFNTNFQLYVLFSFLFFKVKFIKFPHSPAVLDWNHSDARLKTMFAMNQSVLCVLLLTTIKNLFFAARFEDVSFVFPIYQLLVNIGGNVWYYQEFANDMEELIKFQKKHKVATSKSSKSIDLKGKIIGRGELTKFEKVVKASYRACTVITIGNLSSFFVAFLVNFTVGRNHWIGGLFPSLFVFCKAMYCYAVIHAMNIRLFPSCKANNMRAGVVKPTKSTPANRVTMKEPKATAVQMESSAGR